jgi:succinate dehydrogenase / fumarate reductase cytochrome b subunit
MAEASPGARPRPLSPHLQVWRWHITLAASITTRATGVGLYAGWLVFAGWVVALVSGPEIYGAYVGLLTSLPGQIVLFLVTLSLFFHMASGVRHLFWDGGKGFTPRVAEGTAWFAYGFALVGAIVVWVLAAMVGGH